MQNEETKLKIESAYSALSIDKKISLLSILALELTISARGTYPAEGEAPDKPRFIKLLWLNEIQHTVAGQLASMIEGDENRYPDDVFIEIAFEKASNGVCESDLLTALMRSFKRVGVSLDGF